MRCIPILALAACLAGGCGERPAPAAPAQRGVFDSQLQAIDKARGVESTVQEQADAQRRAIEEAERR
jgi:hypothetical protein